MNPTCSRYLCICTVTFTFKSCQYCTAPCVGFYGLPLDACFTTWMHIVNVTNWFEDKLIFFLVCSAGTNGSMYTLILATHALNNETTTVKDMYVGECQDSSSFNQDLVQGSLLICSYSIRFVLGLSTIKQALQTAKNLSATGVVFYMDPFVIGFQLNPVPLQMPGIIIPSSDISKVWGLCVFDNECAHFV